MSTFRGTGRGRNTMTASSSEISGDSNLENHMPHYNSSQDGASYHKTFQNRNRNNNGSGTDISRTPITYLTTVEIMEFLTERLRNEEMKSSSYQPDSNYRQNYRPNNRGGNFNQTQHYGNRGGSSYDGGRGRGRGNYNNNQRYGNNNPNVFQQSGPINGPTNDYSGNYKTKDDYYNDDEGDYDNTMEKQKDEDINEDNI